MRDEEKLKIKNSSILLSIALLLFAIVVLLAILPRPIHNKNLSTMIESTLSECEKRNGEEGRYKLGKRINLNSSVASSTYVFELTDFYDTEKKNSSENKQHYALVTRIVGMNGPVPVVFVGTSSSLVFCAVAGTKQQSDNIVMYGLTPSIINYNAQNLQNALYKTELNQEKISEKKVAKNDKKR